MKPKSKILLSGLVLVAVLGAYVAFSHRPAMAPAKPNASTANSTPAANQPATDSFNKKQYSLTDPASLWVVVNKQRPLNPLDYAPADLVAVGNGQQLRADAAAAFAKLVAGAKAAGLTLSAQSGYRSYQTQMVAYNSEVQAYGKATADAESARPGYSEHQTGLAVDVGGGGCNVQDCFGTTPEGKWLAANAYKYGFIIRYPAGKQAITGYRAESWHVRYIGTALAAEMHRTNTLTLEEFFGLPPAPNYQN